MSSLTDFYLGKATDAGGRAIDAIWGWSDEELEEVHDYIQWLFPTPTRSTFHPSAPVLTEEDIAAFRADKLLQARLHRSFLRFLTSIKASQAPNAPCITRVVRKNDAG